MPFSPGDLAAIAAFAAQLGVSARPARDGTFSFRFSEAGTLTLTPSADGERSCVTLARRPDRLDAAAMGAILAEAGWDPALGTLVQAGLTADGELLLTVGLARDALSLPAMEAALQALMAKSRAAS